ncbi:MAG: GldG family protein [Myxococcales bacterium]|nr:GldG family protein [Myxococcales bacterium]
MSAARKRKRRQAKGGAAPPAAEIAKAPRDASEREPSRFPRIWSATGVAAAIVIAVLANVLAARHYRRWDLTEEGLYSLSRVTEDTLRRTTEPIDVFVLLPSGDPLSLTMRHLLEAYRAVTPNLVAHFVDPDHSPAELMAIQQRFGLTTAKTDDGRVVTDANIVVARGERKHFITADELFEVEPGAEMRARSRVEKTLTEAIAAVTRGEPRKLCFLTGYGEPDYDSGGVEGLLMVRSRVEKLNFTAQPLPPLRDGGGDIDACALVIVPGPSVAVPEAESRRLVGYVERGGSLLLFMGPEPGEDGRFLRLGLDEVLHLAGVHERDDVVFERDPARRWAVGAGEAFLAVPKPHAVTTGLVELQGAIDVVITVASSLALAKDAKAPPTVLLETSERAFGMKDFAAWARDPREPEPSPGDETGPLVLATATQLPGEHGGRLVVVASKSPIVGASWTDARLQGTGLFVESAISWLAADPVVLDIPQKPAKSLSLGLTEEVLNAAALKIVVLLPLSMVLLGIGVNVRRRASEGRRRDKANKKGDQS